MAELDLALVFTPDLWVEELHRHLADHGGARVLHLVVDPAMALHEHFDVLVVSWRWAALTPGFVDELHLLGRHVLGVADRDERGAADVLAACAVDAVVDSDAAPWEFVEVLATIDGARTDRDRLARPNVAPPTRTREHPWIAVGGPAGAGRTEIALELARATRAVVVDCDAGAPALAARLGLALEPNVRTAIDAVEFGIGDVDHAMQAVTGLAGGVVCGVPSAAAWTHTRPPELLRALHALSRGAPIVIDTAAVIDDGDAGSPRARSALARAILGEADAVVAVGVAAPLGVVRLLTWLADLAGEVLRSFSPASLAHVPDDERVRVAGWNGTVVGRGGFTKAVAGAADRVVGELAPKAVAS
jgi:hypothetical protein